MEVKAIHKGARISAQKTRLVADQIRGLPIARALNILNFSPKKAAFIVKKVVESAMANAEHNKGAVKRFKEVPLSTIIVETLSASQHALRVVAIKLKNKHVTLP